MRIIICWLILFFFLNNIEAKTYYVSTSGSNSNSGISTSFAWKTLTYAAGTSSPVVAGDIVYVQAGNYGAEQVVFKKSGTAANPISFIGYKNTPGDNPPLIINNSNPYTVFKTSDMPTYNGGDRSKNIGFDCEGRNYLILKNFQIQNYRYGLVAGSKNTTGNINLYNINVMTTGDVNASYSGNGFLFGSMSTSFSDNNSITNCMVVNAGAEGFSINGNHNIISGCKVYCNDNTGSAATDYYIIITGDYNTVTGCYIERTPGLSHLGHGISIKSNAEQVVDQGLSYPIINPQYNKVMYCVARNMDEAFCVRHRGVQHNLFYHCKAIGTRAGPDDPKKGEGNCIVTRDGASNNTFDGCIAENCVSGIAFKDTVEDGDTGSNAQGHPGNENLYINCLFYNCYYGVDYNDYSIKSDAGDNTIANCTFYKIRCMFIASRHCANMIYDNDIFYGCLPSKPGGYFYGGTYKSDIIPNGTNTFFKNCDFVNIEGGMPANFISNSSGSIAADPLFKDATVYDFHLTAQSPCIDDGNTLPSVHTDYDSIPRPLGKTFDMGAFEFSTLTINVSFNNVSCNGGNNGSATVIVTGGTAPYTYSWSNGQTDATATGLASGTYSITVIDSTSLVQKTTVVISQPSQLGINNISVVNATTCLAKDGSISITPSGGTGSYTYNWNTSPVQTTNEISGLVAEQYTCMISDANSCSFDTVIAVTCATDVNQLKNEKDEFLIYPNPVSGILNIVVKEKGINIISVLDITGRKLFEEKTNLVHSKIDLSRVANGTYFLQIENKKYKKEMKIILNR